MFKSLFDPDSAFGRATETVLNLVILNVLWLVCSLPIITIGASGAALYSVLFKMVEDKDTRITRQFFAAFRGNARRATGIWLILLVVIAVTALLVVRKIRRKDRKKTAKEPENQDTQS